MSKVKVRGGFRLTGQVNVSGSKYMALAAIPAALLADSKVTIENMPDLSDVRAYCRILNGMGAEASFRDGVVTIDSRGLKSFEPDSALVRKIRASYYLISVLLSRFGRAVVAPPGGDEIGPRPIDQHIKGFNALGAKTEIEHGYIVARSPKLKGTTIYMDVASVGATINLMLAAVLAEGQTEIINAYQAPWIVDLANMLNAMGARITGAGTEIIRIRGVRKLYGCHYHIEEDQSEAATFAIASAITGGDIIVGNIIPMHLKALIAKLKESGAVIEEEENGIRVKGPARPKAVNVQTLPYPGFFTDFQAPMSAMLTIAEGTSIVNETIWDERFKHLIELSKMGADAQIIGRTAIIEGVPKLTGAVVNGCDIRASVSLVLAGLKAEGDTIINNIEHMDRGYEHLDRKLISLGANIIRLSDD